MGAHVASHIAKPIPVAYISHMHLRVMFIVLLIALLAAGAGAGSNVKRDAATGTRAESFPAHSSKQSLAQETSMSDIFAGDSDTLSYEHYFIAKRRKRVRLDYPQGLQRGPLRIHSSYAVLQRKGRVLAEFDDNIYSTYGNNIRFGLFAFLPGPTKQLLVSQEVFRGGTQWVINFSLQPRTIFDGPRWEVGREGDDMSVIDLDHDGTFEIIVPLTDFYVFQDKLPIARIPLPRIVFKYNDKVRKYVPANPLFESYMIPFGERTAAGSADEFDQRARALEQLLTLIYAGRRSEAWETYRRTYKLGDAAEIQRRIEAILVKQPVYKFIYNNASRK